MLITRNNQMLMRQNIIVFVSHFQRAREADPIIPSPPSSRKLQKLVASGRYQKMPWPDPNRQILSLDHTSIDTTIMVEANNGGLLLEEHKLSFKNISLISENVWFVRLLYSRGRHVCVLVWYRGRKWLSEYLNSKHIHGH